MPSIHHLDPRGKSIREPPSTCLVLIPEQRALITHPGQLLIVVLSTNLLLGQLVSRLVDSPVRSLQRHGAEESGGGETKSDAKASWVAGVFGVEEDVLGDEQLVKLYSSETYRRR